VSVGAYLRVSDPQQVEKFSLPAQRTMIAAHCEREGWPEPAWFVEDGRSALSDDFERRPQFRALLAAAEAGVITRVVVVDTDRFARSVVGGLAAAARLEAAGCRLSIINQPGDLATPEGEMQFTLHLMFARYESRQKGRRVKAAVARMKAEGKWPGGSPPFGALRDSDGYLQLDPAKAPTLARALDLAATTTHYRAAELLNAEGHPPPGTYRKQRAFASSCWTRQSVYWLIAKGQWLLSQPDPWPARYLAAASRPASPPVARARTVRALTGLMRCGHCGSAVVYSADLRRGVVRLRCERPGCRRTYGHAWPHEEAVRNRVARLRRKSYPDPDQGVDVAAFVAVAEERRRLARLYRDPRSGVTDEEYDSAMAELDRRERQLAAQGGTARDFGGIEDSLPHLDSLPPEEQNAIYAEIVAEVRVDSKHARRIVFTPAARGAFDGCD
jgi:DNA invertase Pin-like site-specific DNA recombinase